MYQPAGSTRSFSITVLGREVAKVELARQFGGGGPERAGIKAYPKKTKGADLVEIKSDWIVPIVAEVSANLRHINPDLIGNLDDIVLQTERDINLVEACRLLREEKKLSVNDVVDLVFKFGAQTNLFQIENRDIAGGIKSNIRSIVELHWNQDSPVVHNS